MTSGHMLQMRPAGSQGAFYSPQRDFAYVYEEMLKHAAHLFNADYWPELLQLTATLLDDQTEEHNKAWEALLMAQERYINFIGHCCDDGQEKTKDVLAKAGWNEVPPAAQFAWLAMMGTVATGQIVFGLRDIHRLNEVHDTRDLRITLTAEMVRRLNKLDVHENVVDKFRRDVARAVDCGLTLDELDDLVDEHTRRRGSPLKRFWSYLWSITP